MSKKNPIDTSQFEIKVIGEDGSNDLRIIIDKETGVQYLLATSFTKFGSGTGMSILVDENGKPKINK